MSNMVKKIGNYAFHLFLYTFICFCIAKEPHVTITVTDSNGSPLQQAGVGIPFLVEVAVSNSQKAIIKQMRGFDQFKMQERGSFKSMQMINGVTTQKVQFQYLCWASQEGKYFLGPISVQTNSGLVDSKVVELVVSQQPVIQHSDNAQHQDDILFNVTVDKQQVVVGQPITATITFMIPTTMQAKIIQMTPPDWTSFNVTNILGPEVKSAHSNGQDYEYALWQFTLYPKKSGSIIIPAAHIVYEVPIQDSFGRDMFGSFFSSFGFGAEKRQAWSGSNTIQVQELPPYEKPINAIGSFSSVTMHLSQLKARAGEGVVLSIDIVGTGDFERLQHPQLQLPSGLKYYDSKSYIYQQKRGTETRKKTFEYIVQGIQPGVWEIPKQDFIFFDIKDYIYKTLQTNPENLTIEAIYDDKKNIEKPLSAEHTQEQSVSIDTELQPIVLNAFLQPVQWSRMSWRMFLFLFLVPAILWIMFMLRTYVQYVINRCKGHKKQIFKRARKKLSQQRYQFNVQTLDEIFKELFAERFQISSAQISQNDVQKYLAQLGFSIDEIEEWGEWYESITAGIYGNSSFDTAVQQALIQQAEGWLNRLEKIW